MNRLVSLVATLALSIPLAHAAEPAAATPGPAPDVLISDTARAMLKELDAHRAEYARDPLKVQQLVDTLLLPHFDVDYAARLVIGKYWGSTTPDQRKRFIDAFYKSLLRTYGASVTDFTADRLIILPFKGDPAARQAVVKTLVKRDNGAKVPVNYTLRSTPQGWKVWDLNIEGISYVRNFKADFGSEIEQSGIEAVIARLEGGAPARPAGKAAGG